MTPLILLQIKCFIVAFLALILHILVDANEMKKKSKIANVAFTFKMYVHDEWITHVASFVSILIVLFFIKDLLDLDQRLGNWMVIIFGTVGYIGNSAVSKLFGTMAKRIDNVIDEKTNIADGKPK